MQDFVKNKMNYIKIKIRTPEMKKKNILDTAEENLKFVEMMKMYTRKQRF
jgi:hypothetical protein